MLSLTYRFIPFLQSIAFVLCAAGLLYASPTTLIAVDSLPPLQWIMDDGIAAGDQVVDMADIVDPSLCPAALAAYAAGDYRTSLVHFEKLRALSLPDGRGPMLDMAAAECRNMLGLGAEASVLYAHVLSRAPVSPFSAAALFRLICRAADDRRMEQVDSLFSIMKERYATSPLMMSAQLVVGRARYSSERFDDAEKVLHEIPEGSARHAQARFIAALCAVRLGETDRALIELEYVRRHTVERTILDHVAAVMGDIYLLKKQYDAAIPFYKAVERSSVLYPYTTLRTARALLDRGDVAAAARIARGSIAQESNPDFFHDAADILERCYAARGQRLRAARLSTMVERRNATARMAFGAQDELSRVRDIGRRWQIFSNVAHARADQTLSRAAEVGLAETAALEHRLRELLVSSKWIPSVNDNIPGFTRGRYLSLVRRERSAVGDSLRFVRSDSLRSRALALHAADLDSEYALLRRATVGSVAAIGLETQVASIDWAFLDWFSARSVLDTSGDTLESVDSLRSRDLAERRDLLGEHMQMFLDAYPGNRFTAQVLFRLAELRYDRAADDFEERLAEYERHEADTTDTTRLLFPDYDLEPVIACYKTIAASYPSDPVADDALFQLARSLDKAGNGEEAAAVYEQLVARYPESDYLVEAWMASGTWWFEHPEAAEGTGYRRAEEAFKHVLAYREHPQFVQAVYQLGWCYYMQDRYDDAIAAFRYLVEEAHVSFSDTAVESGANPLMRDEAVDYIAISFDEKRDIDESVKFLAFIGNTEYAARVLLRIGTLRMEDLDYAGAAAVYSRLIAEYPLAAAGPEASIGVIRALTEKGDSIGTLHERRGFVERYSRGSVWYRLPQRDSAQRIAADSMTVSMALWLADESYRSAEAGTSSRFKEALELYHRIADEYSENRYAPEALFNAAVIEQDKTGELANAFNDFTHYSRLPLPDTAKRELAALNALALAQRMVPAELSTDSGAVDSSTVRVAAAARNYIELFPGGLSLGDVVISLGAVYFNRHMYTMAEAAYKTIVDKGPRHPSYASALSLMAQSVFAQERFREAGALFEGVFKSSADSTAKAGAFTHMIQARMLEAKSLADAGSYVDAADAYSAIDDRYPQSAMGDVALFNAGAALQKRAERDSAEASGWIRAARAYCVVPQRYTASAFAPDALFNAALCYEKAAKWQQAAETYEQLVSAYPAVPKARDALFNEGLCFEKLEQPEKVAEVNERYARLYPGEADVEAMLLRSAAFYTKTLKSDRAEAIYTTYLSKYPSHSAAVEAHCMLGRIRRDRGDTVAALASFESADRLSVKLAQEGRDANSYYAGEAAFEQGRIRQLQAAQVLFNDPLRAAALQKERTEKVGAALLCYQRVAKYRSERLFEAAVYSSELYRDLAAAWAAQVPPASLTDDVARVLFRRDIAMAAASLSLRGLDPLRSTVLAGRAADTLSPEASRWITAAVTRASALITASARYSLDAASALLSAPVAPDVAADPLFLFQYRSQLYTTVEPILAGRRTALIAGQQLLDTLRADSLVLDRAVDAAGAAVYAIPAQWDSLAADILSASTHPPKDMDATARDELVFQLEDMAYEAQDKSLFAFEDAQKIMRSSNLTGSAWYRRIMGRLARLSPENYGVDYFSSFTDATGDAWFVRPDSTRYWVTSAPDQKGWALPRQTGVGIGGRAAFLAAGSDTAQGFFWHSMVLPGSPVDGTVRISSSGPYRIWLNEKLLKSDTAMIRSTDQVDSLSGIASMLRGGDNIVAVHVRSPGTIFALSFSGLIDTAQHFRSMALIPAVSEQVPRTVIDTMRVDTVAKKPANTATRPSQQSSARTSSAPPMVTQRAVLDTTALLHARSKETDMQIRRERISIAKLYMKKDSLDARITQIKSEINVLKKTKR